MSRVRIILRGPLRDLHSGPIEVVARTAAEALEQLGQIPGLRPDANGPKRLRVGGMPTQAQLHEPLEVEELHLFPQVNGGGNSGFIQVLIGIILIAVLVITVGVAGIGAALTAGAASTLTTLAIATVFMIGVNLIIGGLMSMLFPQPELGKQGKGSMYLGPPQSTTRIGTPIAVQYGRRKRGFHYLSYSMFASKQGTGGTVGVFGIDGDLWDQDTAPGGEPLPN
jgi:predicted phage tail protein